MRIKSLPFLISLEQGSAPAATRISSALRDAVREGRLAPGEPLPSSRDLAKQLGVARNTVLGAIALLVDTGLLETRPGAGTFVRATPAPEAREDGGHAHSFHLTDWAQRLAPRPIVLEGMDTRFDLRPGIPDLRAIPFDEWRRSAVRKLRTLRVQIGAYGLPEGDADLRQEIAYYVARSRGVLCKDGDVIVTSGAQQAFDLITRVLIRPGMPVAVEDPGYQPAARAFLAGGAALHAVAVDGDGIDVSSIPDGTSIAYVTPSHQYPLGVTMSDERRRALLAWAARKDAVIIEDDYDSEYRYTDNDLPALQASDTADRVLYVGTFSKNLMPGIRLGYLILPRALRSVFVAAKWLVDRHSDNMSQAVLAGFMANGMFARHVVTMRQTYKERHAALAAFGDELSGLGAKLLPSNAGLHTCLVLPDGTDEAGLIADAARHGVGLYGLSSNFAGSPAFPGLVLGFGNLGVKEIQVAMSRLVSLLSSAAG